MCQKDFKIFYEGVKTWQEGDKIYKNISNYFKKIMSTYVTII